MITTKDKFLIISGILLILALIIINFVINPVGKPAGGGSKAKAKPVIYTRAESVEPLQNQTGLSVVPQIVVNFSATVTGQNVELKTDPKANFSAEVDKTGKRAIFSPKSSLEPNTAYNFQVFVEDQPIFSWVATTKNVGTSQSDLAAAVNKIREKLPYKEASFRVSYDAATDQFFIFIEVAPYQKSKDNAVSWLNENGLADFAALNINYVAKGSVR